MDFEKLLKYRNECSPYTKWAGIVTHDIKEGYAYLTKEVVTEDMNLFQNAHGGAVFALADTAAGVAAASHGFKSVTINCTYNYLRGALLGDTLTAIARETKSGRTICVYDVEVKNQDDKLLGTGTFTYFMTDEPLPI